MKVKKKWLIVGVLAATAVVESLTQVGLVPPLAAQLVALLVDGLGLAANLGL